MRKSKNVIIAVDPDVDMSGIAILYRQTKEVETFCYSFPVLIDWLRRYPNKEDVTLVVEAGWLNESNWHLNCNDSKRKAAAKGNSTGRNHEVGRKICECAEFYGLEVVKQKPLKKSWKGKDGKITHEELAYFVPGLPKSTNQEKRDAVLLAWNYADFPIKINVRMSKKRNDYGKDL